MNNMFEEKQLHPSYGLLGFYRTQCTSKNLFGSSIDHSNTVVMTVKEASCSRHLNQTSYYGEGEIIEVEMSYSQFCDAIVSMNCGEGVPVTLRRVHGETLEDPPQVDVRKQFESEFKDHLNKAFDSTKEMISQVEELLSSKKPFNKSDKDELLSMLSQIKMGIGCNSEFVYKQFNRQMDSTVKEAKAEVEGFVQTRIMSAGVQALNGQVAEAPKLLIEADPAE